MSTVHHALFGDAKGRHGVIACSRDTDPLVEAIRARSDLAPDRPAHVSWTTYTTGIRIEDVFAVMRTVPAPEASRPGMVLTHAAFLPIEDAVVLDDVGRLLSALPDTPWRNAVLNPTALRAAPPPVQLSTALHEALLNAVVMNDPSQPLGWIGPDGFEDAARAVWSLMSPEERASFSFSFAFNPKSILTGAEPGLALVRTPRPLRDRWGDQRVIDPLDPPEIVPSPTIAALLGRDGGEEVRAVMDALGLARPALRDHAVLEIAATYLATYESGQAPPVVVQTLARAIGKLAPSPDQGEALKSRVALALADGTRSAEDILGFRNLDLAPFSDGADVLGRAAASWVTRALSDTSARSASDADVVQKGLDTDAPPEWARAVQKALRHALRSWKRGYAAPVWRWWREDASLIEAVIAQARPAQTVERDVVAAAPDDLPHPGHLRSSARKHGMLHLHAHVVSSETPTAEAFTIQFAADPDGTDPRALDYIAERVGARETVLAAVGAPEHEHVVDLAGAAATDDPNALSGLDASQEGWRVVWASAVAHGAEVWAGIPDPVQQRDALLQQDDEPTRALLPVVADTDLANLLDHPERRHLWKRIPSDVRAQFIDATARAWVEQLQAGGDAQWDLERELASAVFDPDRNATLFDPSRPGTVRLAIEAFGRSPVLDQSAFCSWIERLAKGPRLSKSDAVLLGSLVAQNGWGRAAGRIFNKAEWVRRDFWDAVAQFSDLLGFWQRMSFHFKSGKHEVSEDDWWSLLEEASVDLLETASDLEYVWEKAGGKVSDLKVSGTGKSRSRHAVSLVRKGKGVRPREFLNVLQEEYSSNNRLELLDQIGRTVGVLPRVR